MDKQENMNITPYEDEDEDEQEQEFTTLYKALQMIYTICKKGDTRPYEQEEWEAFFNKSKNTLGRRLKKLFGKDANTYLKKHDGNGEYNIPVKGINCIALLLDIDLKEELGREYGGELSRITSKRLKEGAQSERKKYFSDVGDLFRAAFEDTDVAARLYFRSQLKLLFSGCSDEVQRKIARVYNMKYIPNAKKADENFERLKKQVDKLLECWDADQGTFHHISETCNMNYRYIVSELEMLLFKRLFKPETQNIIAKLQP